MSNWFADWLSTTVNVVHNVYEDLVVGNKERNSWKKINIISKVEKIFEMKESTVNSSTNTPNFAKLHSNTLKIYDL